MKKKVMVAALVLVSSAAVFASGNKEDDNEYYERGPRMENRNDTREFRGRDWQDQDGPQRRGGMVWFDEEGNPITPEEISAEGTLVLEEGTMPYLETEDGKVFLMIPPFAIAEVDLEGGETIKVKGYDMPTDRWGNKTESVFLHVLSADIDGETFTLDMGRAGGRDRHHGKSGRGNW
ncbi:hypothetical protein EXM22_13210 [Oceanispirochaeta crateris]|uniref:Uncharacterized protein n=1 Tax=Oceanispirochaeta crateris TaxID=2518645 RepID=A0A5C1QS39_9SPIO|nr:hypothetical protein [Oceanispirochaeta crateris]QEN08902.1 hypothetical protein EXM22_13210 [Oceanispirochaeta crateris]